MKKFLNKNLIGLIAIAVLFACGGIAYGAVESQEPDRGENPLVMENPNNKEVFPEGKGYSLSKSKAKEYQLPEKNQKQDNLIMGSASRSFNSSLSSFSFSSRRNGSNYRRLTIDYSPTVSIIMSDKTAMKDTVTLMESETLAFDVRAKLYGNSKISKDNVTVKYGSETLKCKNSDDNTFGYELEVKEGKNVLKVTVEDIARTKVTKKACVTEKTVNIIGTENKPTNIVFRLDAFEGFSSDSTQKTLKSGETERVSNLINDMLGDTYTVASKNKKITSISSEIFGDRVTLTAVNGSDYQKLIQNDKYVEGLDFDKTIFLDEDNRTIGDGSFVIDSDKLESGWKIYLNGKETTMDKTVKSGDKVELVFRITEKQ